MCACIIGSKRSPERSSRTNGQWSELCEDVKTHRHESSYAHACLRCTGHFEVGDLIYSVANDYSAAKDYASCSTYNFHHGYT